MTLRSFWSCGEKWENVVERGTPEIMYKMDACRQHRGDKCISYIDSPQKHVLKLPIYEYIYTLGVSGSLNGLTRNSVNY